MYIHCGYRQTQELSVFEFRQHKQECVTAVDTVDDWGCVKWGVHHNRQHCDVRSSFLTGFVCRVGASLENQGIYTLNRASMRPALVWGAVLMEIATLATTATPYQGSGTLVYHHAKARYITIPSPITIGRR